MPRTAKSSRDSRGRLIGAAVLVFLATFFLYAHTDPLDILYHLLVDGCLLGVWLVSAWGFGSWVTLSSKYRISQKSRAVPGPTSRGEHAPALPNFAILLYVTRIAIGLGVMSILILLLGLAGWFGEISSLVLLGAGFVLTIFAIASHHTGRRNFNDTIQRWLAAPAQSHWLLLLLAPFAGMMAAGGLVMPGLLWGATDPAGYDVVEYHLQVPREWYELGRIVPLHHNVFSYMPFNVEMHYLLAMNLHAGPWAGMFLAQWMHGTFILLTVLAIYAAARAFVSPLAAVLAALAAGFCPWLVMLGSVAYDEGGLLLYGTLAIAWIVVQIGDKNSPMATALIAGLCAGFACGCKLTGVPILLVALPIIFLTIRPRAATARAALVYIGAAILAFSPWLIRNQIWTHNPVFPEEMLLLGHGDFSPIQVARWHQAHSPRPDQHSLAAHLKAFWNEVIQDWRFAYVLLPLSLLAALVSLRSRATQILLGALIAMILFWLIFTHLEGRFFVLAIPIMAMLLAGIPRKFLHWVAIPIIISAVPSLFLLHQNLFPAAQTIGLESPTLLRSQAYPPEINDAVAQDKPLILVGDAKAFWFDIPMSRLHYRTVFDADTSDNRSTISAWLAGTENIPDANVIVDPGELNRFSKTYLGIPPLPPALRDLRQPTVFDLHDPRLSNSVNP